MVKKFIHFVFILLLANIASASIMITEVLYDPVNESGGEAVELYNSGEESVDISFWVLSTESSAADATIPQGTFILPDSYFLVADVGFGSADYNEALTLANSDAGVAISSNGTIIDAVGWGNSAGIELGLFEGSAASPASEGQSIQRKKTTVYSETQNNSFDFFVSTPALENSSSISGSVISVTAIVQGSSARIDWVNLSDDFSQSGFQIAPFPGKNRTVVVKAQISSDIESTISASVSFNGTNSLAKTQVINSTSAIFEGNFSLPFHTPPGNHLATIHATSSNLTTSVSENFEVMSLLSIELDASDLIFAGVPGISSFVEGDENLSSQGKVSIINSGNTMTNLTIHSTLLSYQSSTIAPEKIEYSIGTSFSGPNSGNLSLSKKTIPVSLLPNSISAISFRLNIPSSATPGNYTGKIFLGAVP